MLANVLGIFLTAAAWNAFWLPPLLVLSKQCVNGCREIRQRAISYLQRLLLSPQLLSGDQSTLPMIFDRVLFPVMDELLKPQVYERDPQGMAETRLKAATILCKIFLQYVVRLVESEAVVGLFVRVLDKLERFMRGEKDMLVGQQWPQWLGLWLGARADRTERGGGVTQERHTRDALFGAVTTPDGCDCGG